MSFAFAYLDIDGERYYTRDEVAARLNISPRLIQRVATNYRIPSTLTPSTGTVYRAADIDILTSGPQHEPLLTPNEAAQRLHASTNALRVWAREGKLACLLTPGGRRRYAPTELDRFNAIR
ncbi:helix-turn-helix domain-containing protein [Nocardiopsis sp. NPDC049922]|uniref:helix-turn-helix domain-containing protein n=1 Tax=Nocardiopsis sp. NPDC049922 TaxID=3155157 RepID=UPI0033E74205